MPAEATKEIMTGIPASLNTVWRRTTRQNRSQGLIRAWHLAKRHPEFWTKFGPGIARESDCKTTRIRLPEPVHAYVLSNKEEIQVPVAHTISALLYLAFTDISNALYDPDFAEKIEQIDKGRSQAA